jgi:hypothetical protein
VVGETDARGLGVAADVLEGEAKVRVSVLLVRWWWVGLLSLWRGWVRRVCGWEGRRV